MERESLQRATDFDGIPGLLGVQPPPYFTSRISLDPKFNDAVLVDAKQRSIWPLDLNIIIFDKY